jgi:cytochrome oxidase Cu insertion factor (SCO1/SenC/PrrC family)
MNETTTISQNRRSLVVLFAIGFVPVIIAWVVFFYFPQLMPTGTTNEGELITPPVQAETLGLAGQTGEWTLILPIGANCNEDCQERLYLARQVNVALGKEAPRVHRLALWTNGMGPAAEVLGEYPELESLPVDGSLVASTLGDLNRIYLMDPLGNIFMVYSVDKAGKPMLKDIKHLLKISNIG